MAAKMKINKKELSKELLKSFHTQFAENQREREKSFLQILLFLAGPIAGNAYVYHNYLAGKNSTPPVVVTDLELFAVEAASAFLLFVGAWMIVTLSQNFRRDQYVNTKIRLFCGLIGDKKIFPKGFNPAESLKDNGIFTWMPNFYLVFYGAFVGIQFFLLIMFFVTIKPYFVNEIQNMDLLEVLSIGV